MSAALVGLLLLQFYWIRNVHELHDEQFKSEVDEAVESAILDVENYERNLLYSNVNSNSFNSSLSSNQFSFGDALKGYESISIQDSSVIANDNHLDYLILSGVTVDSASGVSAQHRVVTQNANKEIGTDLQPVSLNNNFENNLMAKSKYLNELMLKMFTTNVFDDITLRMNPTVLDTLIKTRLSYFKIDTLFNFRITEKSGELIEFIDARLN
jgi:two-component system phosphate regulon sensor histidine kinase PhoR